MNNVIKSLQEQIQKEQDKIANCSHHLGTPFFNLETKREACGYKTIGQWPDVKWEAEGYKDVTVPRWTRVCSKCGKEEHTNMYIDFTSFKDFIALPSPVIIGDVEVLGHFPYEKAQLSNDCVRISPSVISEDIGTILYKNGIYDNNIVVVFRDRERFNKENFAIQIKDGYCKVGRWKDVIGYAGRELR